MAPAAPLLTVEFWMVRPAAPVAVIRPALVSVPLVLSSRATLAELALIVPPTWLFRVSWPIPNEPPPEMVLSTLVRTEPAVAP